MSTRNYADAVDHLNSCQSNAATLEALRASGGRMSELAMPEMLEYLERIGYRPEDLNRLNVIHVTGTKGKGSTCAFTDSILRHTMANRKIGLYTSPHLVAVRERIRINGAPISEALFTKFFFEVWDRLEENDVRKNPSTSAKPAYFRFVTLVAFHAFLSLEVDATILEVGVGGTYDSTNVVPKPIVTGVSSLGLDHVNVLGKTLKEIGWQKGGIYKEGVPAFTVNQPEEGFTALKERATELKASKFELVAPIPGLSDIKLGLAGQHQLQNAALAVNLARAFLETRGSLTLEDPLPEPFIDGLKKAKWPGRCQAVNDPTHENTTWYLDGAHTVESLHCCIQWFVSPGVALIPSRHSTRILIFNCTGGRAGLTLLSTILTEIAAQLKLHDWDGDSDSFFDHVVFCTNVTYADGGYKSDLTAHNVSDGDLQKLKVQRELASAWCSLVPNYPPDNIHVLPSIEDAVKVVRQSECHTGDGEHQVQALVAGSLHLVGGVIEVAGLSEVAL